MACLVAYDSFGANAQQDGNRFINLSRFVNVHYTAKCRTMSKKRNANWIKSYCNSLVSVFLCQPVLLPFLF